MTDYALRCNNCDMLIAPLEQEKAVELATDHCERTEHTDVHALPFEDMMPLVGTFDPLEL